MERLTNQDLHGPNTMELVGFAIATLNIHTKGYRIIARAGYNDNANRLKTM